MVFACLLHNPFALCCPDQTKSGTVSAKAVKIVKKRKDAQPCVPQLVSGHSPRLPNQFKFRKEERYRPSPVVHYEVEPDGKVSNVKLTQSSGVKDVDDFAVDWVKKLKYKSAPGCVGIESEIGITIDFR